MIEMDQPARETSRAISTPELPQASAARTLPAGKVLGVMVVAFMIAALFNSGRFVHAAETLPYGWQRTALLAVAHPVDDVAHALRLDRPRAQIDAALGRRAAPASGGAFGPAPAEATEPTPSASSPESSPQSSPESPSDTPPTTSPPQATAFRDATTAAPLRLLVVGDSMIEFMGPKLIKLAPSGTVAGRTEVKYGTGLVRDDVFDWPAYARAQLASRDPEAIVVMMGGNDGQNIELPGRRILAAGSPEWRAEYRRRATLVMGILTDGGRRHVYWMGIPQPRSPRLAVAYVALNDALRSAAAVTPGARFIDVWPDFSPDGRYTYVLADGAGRPVLVRARDGIHVNRDGAARVARTLYGILDADWRLAS